MAYSGVTDWRAAFTPMARALDGNHDPIAYDEDWDDAGSELDPWGEMGGDFGEVEDTLSQRVQAERQEFTFPTESDPGRQLADRTAARRGVNPGRKGGGAGQFFDLAKSFLGTPYVFGAGGPSAFDCSGFVKYLYERTYGASLPHSARAQALATRQVSRDDIRPGDLIFYAYGRLGNEIDHVEIFMGNGKQIGTSNPTEDLDVDNVDWGRVVRIGRVVGPGTARGGEFVAGPGGGRADPKLGAPKFKTVQKPVERDPSLAPAMLAGNVSSFTDVLANLFTDDTIATKRKVKTNGLFKGPNARIERQLYRGFIDAGREDLARMVGTRDFQTWIGQESGWRVDATSPANNNGLRNDGLFQVWRGHSFNSGGQVSRMSPYEQAQIVTRYFNLTPADIRRYAEQIRSNTYRGWG